MKLLALSAVLLVLAIAPAQAKADDNKKVLSVGKHLFETTCNQCHSIEDPLENESSREEWQDRVQEMIGGTGALTPEQEELVVNYLTVNSTYKANCRGCHDLQKVETARYDQKGWLKIVETEVVRKPGLLSDADTKNVAEFLYLNFGK